VQYERVVLDGTAVEIAQQAYLKASNTEAGDEFGIAVALSKDTLAVGARYEASGATGVNPERRLKVLHQRSGTVDVRGEHLVP
jgi:hypothetical protein